MKIAIMQPYFFPYIGQFQLINAVDKFILCDDVQYIRHGWINRNRVLKQNEGNYYITVPLVKHSSTAAIKEIKAVDGYEWKDRILKQIEHYRKRAAFYPQVRQLLLDCFQSTETNITRINGTCMKKVCDYIGIDFTINISSDMGLDYSGIKETQDWAITICQQVGAAEYINPPGGTELYSKNSFQQGGIKLNFLKTHFREYDQYRTPFEPGLSIIDVMMFNSPEEIKSMLTDYQLV
jgi:hypothetical protein